MIDHFCTQTLVDAVSGFSEEERFQASEHPFQNGDCYQSNTQHLKGVEAALVNHLVDDHLNQQRIRQCEQLNDEAGCQHLDQNGAVALERWPEPTRAKLLFRRGVGAIEQ